MMADVVEAQGELATESRDPAAKAIERWRPEVNLQVTPRTS